MKIVQLWFDGDRLYARSAQGDVYSQALWRYPRLASASPAQRDAYRVMSSGIHWTDIDEDVSFTSFLWTDNDPNILIAQN